MTDDVNRKTRQSRRFDMTIGRLVLVMVAVLVMVLVVLGGVGFQLLRGMQGITDSWTAYDLGAASKADALSELRAYMGMERQEPVVSGKGRLEKDLFGQQAIAASSIHAIVRARS